MSCIKIDDVTMINRSQSMSEITIIVFKKENGYSMRQTHTKLICKEHFL